MLAAINQWNAAQPISRLPPELVPHITALGFPITSYLRGLEEDSPSFYMKYLASLATISGTWRNAIIGTPSLWGLLSTDLPLHINRMSLERAGTCSLLVEMGYCEEPSSTDDEVLELASPFWNRWSHLRLQPSPDNHIPGQLSSPSPSLEVVDVRLKGLDVSTTINLFGGYAPRLQEITVGGVRVMWGPETFRGLRKLVLGGMVKDFLQPDNILTVLTANPLLELLDIEGSLFEAMPLPLSPSAQAPIHLPKLKTIYLGRLCSEAAARIFALIRVPNCESLQLTGLIEWTILADSNKAGLLDQSLGHLDGFLRSSLALHGPSRLRLSNQGVDWLCQGSSSSPYAPGFSLVFPWGNLHSDVLWVSQVLGPSPDLAHRIHAEIRIYKVDAEVLAGLKTLAFRLNVQKLKVPSQLHSVIFDLLGSANDITGLPTFSGLEELQLPMPYDLPDSLRNLEVSLKRRYAKSKRGAARARPMRIIFSGQFYRPGCRLLERRLRFDQLCRIRALQGVESVELVE